MRVDRQMSEPGAAFENVSPESLVALRRENDRDGMGVCFSLKIIKIWKCWGLGL